MQALFGELSKSKSVLPKMLAWSGLVGGKILAPFGAISDNFFMGWKNAKLFSLVDQWLPISPTRLACGVLTVKKGYRLGSADRAVPPSCWTSSPKDLAQARPKPGPGQISVDPEIWGPGNLKKKYDSQNQNPFCPKCRQGLDW